VDAVKKVHAGLIHPRTGEVLFPGFSFGSEAFGANQGWNGFLVAPKRPMRSEVYNYFLFNDPAWDFRTFDFDKDVAYADAKLAHMAAIDPDLSAFRDRGGKIVMYTGWADPVAAPLDVIKYYDAVTKKMGGSGKTEAFFRFFMAPGMGHCGGGYGPNTFDMLTDLENWVEKGEAPRQIVASMQEGGKTVRTRPLCVYPQVARWSKGSTDDAANFTCRAPSRR
jgi:feruloyl esterase